MNKYSDKTIVPIMNADTNGIVTISSSSIYSTSYKNYMAFDGIISGNNAWVSANGKIVDEWLKVDLGEVRLVGKYAITAWASSSAGIPKSFKLQGSFDNLSWDDLDTRTNITLAPSQRIEFENNIKSDKYRYYRLLFQEVQSSTYVTVGEFELFETVSTGRILLKSNNKTYSLKPSSGGRNEILTSNIGAIATVSASSENAVISQAWRAFDGKAGNANERWISSSVAPQWLKYSLKNQPKVLEKYAVYSAGSRQPTAWTLEASNDNVNWTVLDTVSGLSDVTDYSLLYEKTLNLNKSYLHYRLYITSALSSGYVELGEFELYFKSSLEVFELKEPSESNFIIYGASSLANFNLIQYSKNYILQDTVSENADGLWVQDIDRKPLSIKYQKKGGIN